MNRLANGILMGALLLLLMIGTYLQGGSALDSDAPSVFSKTESGRSVLFELYSKLGFEVRAWTQAPGQLPKTDSLLFVSTVPVAPDHYSVVSEVESSLETEERRPLHQRLYDPGHYRAFVEQGGTLLLSVDSAAWRFLAEQFQLDFGVDSLVEEQAEEEKGFLEEALEELEEVLEDDFETEIPEDWDPAEELALDSLLDAPGYGAPQEEEDSKAGFEAWYWQDQAPEQRESLQLSWDFVARIERREDLQPLVATEAGAWVVASQALGRGHLVLLDSDRFLDNDRLGQEQNALLAVRLAERFSGDRRLFFDEYSLGGWTPDSPLEMAFSSDARPLTLHLLLLLALVIWLSSWVRWFPRDPAPLAAVSASMRARGLAGMLMRRRRWEVLGQMLRLGVLRRLGRNAGLSKQLLAEDSALQEPEVLQRLLKPLFHVQDEARLAWAMQLLKPGQLNSRWELDELEIALASLETGALEQAAGDPR